MKLLKKVLLINWHSFSKELIEVGNINFLTGKNAVGKSTIVDAIQLVILGEPKGVGFIVDIGKYSGMGFVGSLNNDYCYVEIPLTVEEDGEYQIKMAYACVEENASLKLYSGTYGRGGNVYFYKEEFFTNVSEDWGIFDENTIVTTSICLKKGKSFILVRSGLIRAEIDYIDLGQKIGDYYEGTYDETLNRNNKGAN